jgi:PhzF family phenazine biosynthesis protein
MAAILTARPNLSVRNTTRRTDVGVPLFQVDAFTDQHFAGNPAAVCLLPEPRQAIWMQQVAREMNLSETAFLSSQEGSFGLRWFTPLAEVDLCGHATLASAYVLWELGWLKTHETARFHTRSGLLSAELRDGLIVLDFPVLNEKPATAPEALLTALGMGPTYVGKFGEQYLLEVADEQIVRTLRPDFQALRAIPGRGVVVTSRAVSSMYDVVSRYFAPWVGIDEDPVTGSVHCCLGPYWSKRLGKDSLQAYQASARGGSLRIQLKNGRVYLGGHAVMVVRGELVA